MEIVEYVIADKEKRQDLGRTICIAAYKAAGLTSVALFSPKSFPKIDEVFPGLFGDKPHGGKGISVDNWQASKVAMAEIQRARRENTR